MINANERLRQPGDAPERQTPEQAQSARPARAHAEHIAAARRDMLSSLQGRVKPALYDALRAKIDYERAALLEIIESDERARQERKRLGASLAAEYFDRKPLDADIL